MSASEIDFASSFSALVLAAQSLPSRQKGRGDTMDKTEALLMMIQALTLGIAIGFQIASMIYRRK